MNGNIYDAALRYLSSRSRTVFEMRKYLAGKGYEEAETESLIAEFLSAGYLNDQDYCRRYFRYALSKGKGKRKFFMNFGKRSGPFRDGNCFCGFYGRTFGRRNCF